MNPFDKPNSKVCSWNICDYNKDLQKIHITELKSDTNFQQYSSAIIQNLKKKISKLYRNSVVYDLDSILGLMYEKGYFLDELIFSALNEMIYQRYIIHDKYGNSGYLINKDDYYLFQPHNNGDIILPLYYRNNNVKERTR